MSETILLGRRRLEIHPLKLGQLRHVLDALEDMAGKSGGALIEAAARVVAAGVAPAHPDITTDTVLDLEATVDELNAAVAAVLWTAGLQPKEIAAGEAPPVASPNRARGSSSPPSTAPSPPAAFIPTPPSTP